MKRILVIEDDTQVRENIEELLELENFEPITAENGLIGLVLAAEQLPDLIICDVMMPKLDGYSVLQALRQNPSTAAIPFVFLTAKAERSDLRQGMNLGADDYLTKPFTPDELRQVVTMRLSRQATITHNYQQQLQQLTAGLDRVARTDQLTGLPNQLHLHERFQKLRLNDSHSYSILVISLDQFHWLRSTIGHCFIESLLKSVGERLKHYSQHTLLIDTLAYDGADQFSILLNPVEKEGTIQIAQAINQLCLEPFFLQEREVFITVSIGIVWNCHSPFLDRGIANAEIAMHHIKRQGGNGYRVYTDQMKINASERLTLEAGLRHALESEQLQVYYQPQVELLSGTVIGAEALARWQHPELGFVSPGKFIPIAEETGLIVPLGEWILQTACHQVKAWQELNGLQLAVNLSARQFNQANLIQRLIAILTTTNFPPSRLELEITESILMQDKKTALEILLQLRELKVNISIDDFGTGYSSLSYLQHFPCNRLKIDQSFVRNIVNNKNNMAIITAVISMAHNLNLQVTGEGVETEDELAFLRQQKCNSFQGYLFSKPLPADEFEVLIRQEASKKHSES